MFPAELFRVAVTVQYGPQWDSLTTLTILIFQKIISRLLLIGDGYLLRRNCSIQWEDYKYDNKIHGGHYGLLSDNDLILLFFNKSSPNLFYSVFLTPN